MPFDEVLGHAAVRADLHAALRRGRLAGAYLFVGPQGVGRRTLMASFAAALLCTDSTDAACGACRACRLRAAGRHPDLVRLERERGRVAVSVEATRAFCREVNLRPVHSARRVGVVDEAASMSAAAANAFLKTLEEPAGDALLLLRAESTDQLLHTIVSRCQVVRLGPLPGDLVARALVDRGACNEREAPAVALLAEGSLGRALTLAQADADQDWTWLAKSTAELTPGESLAFVQGLVDRTRADTGRVDRERTLALLEMLALLYRRRLREELPGPPRHTLARLEAVWRAAERIAGSQVNPELALQALGLDLAQ